MNPFHELSDYWNKPLHLRIRQGHHFLYHLSCLAMCLLILVKVWIICSRWSNESAIDWVTIGIVLAATEITVMMHKAVVMPADGVSNDSGAESGGKGTSRGRFPAGFDSQALEDVGGELGPAGGPEEQVLKYDHAAVVPDSGGGGSLGKAGYDISGCLVREEPGGSGNAPAVAFVAQETKEAAFADGHSELAEKGGEMGAVGLHARHVASGVSECASEYHGHLAQIGRKNKGPGFIRCHERDWQLMLFAIFTERARKRLRELKAEKQPPLRDSLREDARHLGTQAREAYAKAMQPLL